jgi:hypothetical protein
MINRPRKGAIFVAWKARICIQPHRGGIGSTGFVKTQLPTPNVSANEMIDIAATLL